MAKRPRASRSSGKRAAPSARAHSPEVLILSEERARRYEPSGREVCISISNPLGPVPRLSNQFLAVLRLEFNDIVEPSPFEDEHLFDENDAKQIISFMDEWKHVDRIVVHCLAGLSRSPGVAIGLCELFSWQAGDLEKEHPLWNKWVRSELVRVGRGLAPRPGGRT